MLNESHPDQNIYTDQGIGFKKEVTQNKEESIKSINKSKKKGSGIPDYVANRMARRVAIATGLPTLSGMGVFVGSYILISKGIADISPSLTLTVSAAFFLLGLIGLSYGILSASWDEAKGTILGIENISPNIKRMKEAFKTNDNKNK